jgi:6,7-dimethyl-8-ribityllumazine synthase
MRAAGEQDMSHKVTEGNLNAAGLTFAVLVSRFNSFVTERLLTGALDALARSGAAPDSIEIVRVPGSWEMPVAAAELARQKRHDVLICLAAIVRGDTPHFDHIAAEATKGLAQTSLQTGIPVAFGILTTNTLEQAIDRAGAKQGNKGFDAAMTAIEMGNLMRALRSA